MSIITKVIIDTKEYHQLKEIAAAYKALIDRKQQTGSGLCICQKEEHPQTLSLSQITAENDREHAVSLPQKSILPSITNPYENNVEAPVEKNPNNISEDDEKLILTPDDKLEFEEAIKNNERWYFIGPWKDVRK